MIVQLHTVPAAYTCVKCANVSVSGLSVIFGAVRGVGELQEGEPGEARESVNSGCLSDWASDLFVLYLNSYIAVSALTVQGPQICFRVWRTAYRFNEAHNCGM